MINFNFAIKHKRALANAVAAGAIYEHDPAEQQREIRALDRLIRALDGARAESVTLPCDSAEALRPVRAEAYLDDVPVEDWPRLLIARAELIPKECGELPRFWHEAKRMYAPLGYVDHDDLIRRGLGLDPQDVAVAFDGLRLGGRHTCPHCALPAHRGRGVGEHADVVSDRWKYCLSCLERRSRYECVMCGASIRKRRLHAHHCSNRCRAVPEPAFPTRLPPVRLVYEDEATVATRLMKSGLAPNSAKLEAAKSIILETVRGEPDGISHRMLYAKIGDSRTNRAALDGLILSKRLIEKDGNRGAKLLSIPAPSVGSVGSVGSVC